MSAQELKNFEAQLALLSYAEQLSLMAYLVKLLQEREAENDGFEGDEEARNGLDEAIAEVERGEYEVFHSFDEFKAAMNADA